MAAARWSSVSPCLQAGGGKGWHQACMRSWASEGSQLPPIDGSRPARAARDAGALRQRSGQQTQVADRAYVQLVAGAGQADAHLQQGGCTGAAGGRTCHGRWRRRRRSGGAASPLLLAHPRADRHSAHASMPQGRPARAVQFQRVAEAPTAVALRLKSSPDGRAGTCKFPQLPASCVQATASAARRPSAQRRHLRLACRPPSVAEMARR